MMLNIITALVPIPDVSLTLKTIIAILLLIILIYLSFIVVASC